MIRALAIGLLLAPLAGCASLMDAGIAKYSVEPFRDPTSGQWICCQASIESGKNVQTVQFKATRAADGSYTVDLSEQGIDAATGQQIASQTAGNVAGAITNAAANAAVNALK